MSEVEEETNTCSYEECSGGGRENLSWRCLNGKWVNDYRAFMRKVHLLTPTAFLSRWDWDCLRRDWDKFRFRRRKFCDPFRGSCLCRGDAVRPWRKLRQNMTLPKSKVTFSVVWICTATDGWSCLTAQKQWAEIIRCVSSASSIRVPSFMVWYNRKVDAALLPLMIGQTSSRRLIWLTSGSSRITGRKVSSPKRNGSHFWKLFAVICQQLFVSLEVDSAYV